MSGKPGKDETRPFFLLSEKSNFCLDFRAWIVNSYINFTRFTLFDGEEICWSRLTLLLFLQIRIIYKTIIEILISYSLSNTRLESRLIKSLEPESKNCLSFNINEIGFVEKLSKLQKPERNLLWNLTTESSEVN